jgi:hypothetical protein
LLLVGAVVLIKVGGPVAAIGLILIFVALTAGIVLETVQMYRGKIR